MPSTTPKQKISQVELFGKSMVTIVLAGDTFDDSYNEAQAFGQANGLTFIHPFDDPMVIGKNFNEGKDNGVDNKEIIAVNKVLRSHTIEKVGEVLRAAMSDMKALNEL